MPVILNGNPDYKPRDLGTLKDTRYPYKYPGGLDLRPSSKLHKDLVGAIMERAVQSRGVMSRRYGVWNAVDEALTTYVTLDSEETALKAKDPRKPVSIVVPLSLATLETLLTYLMSAFLEEPIFRYEGVGGEDVMGAMLLELLVNLQARRGKLGLGLHTMCRDALAYGMGFTTPVWTKQMGFRRAVRDNGFMSFFNGFTKTGSKLIREEYVQFEGNELENIDPYSLFLDTNWPVHKFQKSEYIGWISPESRMQLLSKEAQDDTMFNCRYLEHISGLSTLGINHSQRDKNNMRDSQVGQGSTVQRIDVIYMYVDLIPAEWKLSSKMTPERWKFAVAGDAILISAAPLDLDHNMYPLACAAPDFDGYSVSPLSKIESIQGFQTLVSFLYSSHIANVRKAVNDMFVVDPTLVNLNDLMTPSAGRIIRARKKAWGQGVNGLVEQLKVTDITANNLPEAQNISRVADGYTGATDILQGAMRHGSERVSAEEVRGTRGAALSRLERIARLISLQGVQDLSYMYARQTQQFMTQDQYIKIAGPYEEALRAEFGDTSRKLVGPFDIQVNFDVLANDGTLPTNGDINTWLQIFQAVSTNPSLAKTFDITKIFMYVARLSGAKNVRDFQLNTKVVSDDLARREAEKGNIIPLSESGDAGGF